jgi:hypothetical protein
MGYDRPAGEADFEMPKWLVILCLLAAGCAQGPATFKPVDYPAQPGPNWVKSGVKAVEKGSSAVVFADQTVVLGAIRVAVAPDDFYGSKLYDGLDLLLQPLDASNRPVKTLGSMTATLYRFEGETVEGQGEKLLEWSVSAERMAGFWVEDANDRGYRVKLAWDRRPRVGSVTMEVRFVTREGVAFTKRVSAGGLDQPRYRWLDK